MQLLTQSSPLELINVVKQGYMLLMINQQHVSIQSNSNQHLITQDGYSKDKDQLITR